jgi:plastocyanin
VVSVQVRQVTDSWTRLVAAAAAVDLVAVLAVGLAHRDQEALAFGVLLSAGLALLRWRRGLAGRILLALVFVDTEAWMLAAAVSGVAHGDPVATTAVAVVLAVGSLAGLIAVLAPALRLRTIAGVRTVMVGAVVVCVLALAATVLARVEHDTATSAGDLALSARNVAYSTNRLTAPAGEVAFRLTNHDLFWHTFTIKGLGVDMKVPVGATRRVTRRVSPGVYEFYCRIPGHKGAGMHGTLTIQ